MVRFLNSGSEACAITAVWRGPLPADVWLPCVRATTTASWIRYSSAITANRTGKAQAPDTVCDSLGMAEGIEKSVIVSPFNDAESATAIIECHAHRLAAVFIEPIMIFGGAIPAESSFVQALWKVTEQHDILLVADEVPTGVHIGGAPWGCSE